MYISAKAVLHGDMWIFKQRLQNKMSPEVGGDKDGVSLLKKRKRDESGEIQYMTQDRTKRTQGTA